jgi:hypothetical protein
MDLFEKPQQRERLGMEYRHRNQALGVSGQSLTYPNQQEAASKISEHFANGKLGVVLVAQPGVGKTGVALETAYRMCTHPDDHQCVLAKDVHTHSGMNDTSWKEQYERSMLPSLAKNITHRSKIKNELEELSKLRNGLVITDECHIASGVRMTQSKVLKEAGLLSVDNLLVKRNKILNISATPEGILADMMQWGDKAALVILQPGALYKGFQVMIDEQRILNAPPLNTEAEVETMLRFFDERYAGSSKRFFPFRGLSAETIQHIYSVATRLGWTVVRHDSDETIENVDAVMRVAPTAHTIILIKDFWRASKRVIRTHVGGSYEKPPMTRNTSATAQGLTARFCDTFAYTGDWLNPDLRPIHYCDLGAIEQYLEWYNNGCDYRNTTYTSPNLNSNDGHLRRTHTLVHPSNVEGIVVAQEDMDEVEDNYTTSPTFMMREDAHEWAIANMNWDGQWNMTIRSVRPINVNPCNEAGGHGNTHVRYRGKSAPIPTEAEFRDERYFSRGFGSGVRCVPVRTGTTLSFIVLYKESWMRVEA